MVLSPSDSREVRRAARQFPAHVGWLITPRVRGPRRSMREIPAMWAADNDCYNPTNIDPATFVMMLRDNIDIRDRCLFVSAPDVVEDAAATLCRFDWWERSLHGLGYPVALVAQDRLEQMRVPWDRFEALFIGGSTEWKLSQAVVDLMRQARARKKWIHVGRVNSAVRMTFCYHAGADSVDGMHFGIAPGAALRWALPLLRSFAHQASMELV